MNLNAVIKEESNNDCLTVFLFSNVTLIIQKPMTNVEQSNKNYFRKTNVFC